MKNIAVCWVWKFGQHHLRFSKHLEKTYDVKLVSFCSKTKLTVDRFKKELWVVWYTNFDKMLDENRIDILIISTPDYLHDKMMLKALEKGINLFVEKPMSKSIKNSEEVIKISKERNLLVGVDFHKRYDPDYISLKQIIESNRLWQPLYINAYMEDRIEVPTEWFKWSYNSSPIWFLWTHYFDLLRFVLWQEIVKVFAKWQKNVLLSKWIDTYDYIQCLIEFEKWTTATLTFGWILPKWFESIVQQWMSIVWSKNMLNINSQYRWVRCANNKNSYTMNNHFMLINEKKKTYDWYWFKPLQEFVEDIIAWKENTSGANAFDWLVATKVALAIHKSLENWKEIDII